jgi:hypothetical protein
VEFIGQTQPLVLSGSRMGTLPLALCLTLFLLLPLCGAVGVWPGGASAAQAAQLTPEEVYRKCRKSVVRQQGWRDSRYPGKLLVASHSATQMVDECVRRQR